MQPATAPGRPGRRFSPVRILLTVVVLLLVAMWVYAFGFASKEAAYRVDDDAWRERAQQICEDYEAKRLELVDTEDGYIAEPTEEQMLERADVVDRATDILEEELAAVLALPLSTDRDRQIVSDYEGFYRTLIADRRRYTEQLRAFDLQPYTETKVDGGPVTNVITDFTTVNEIKACAPPGELGGDS